MKKITIFLVIAAILSVLGWIYFPFISSWIRPYLDRKSVDQELTELRTVANPVIANESNLVNLLGKVNATSEATTSIALLPECVASPKSARIKYGEKIVFSNQTSGDFYLNFGAIRNVLVKSASSTTLRSIDLITKTASTSSISTIVYSCKGKSGPAGYILITN